MAREVIGSDDLEQHALLCAERGIEDGLLLGKIASVMLSQEVSRPPASVSYARDENSYVRDQTGRQASRVLNRGGRGVRSPVDGLARRAGPNSLTRTERSERRATNGYNATYKDR